MHSPDGRVHASILASQHRIRSNFSHLCVLLQRRSPWQVDRPAAILPYKVGRHCTRSGGVHWVIRYPTHHHYVSADVTSLPSFQLSVRQYGIFRARAHAGQLNGDALSCGSTAAPRMSRCRPRGARRSSAAAQLYCVPAQLDLPDLCHSFVCSSSSVLICSMGTMDAVPVGLRAQNIAARRAGPHVRQSVHHGVCRAGVRQSAAGGAAAAVCASPGDERLACRPRLPVVSWMSIMLVCYKSAFSLCLSLFESIVSVACS